MDSSSRKRKAPLNATPSSEGSASKRLKILWKKKEGRGIALESLNRPAWRHYLAHYSTSVVINSSAPKDGAKGGGQVQEVGQQLLKQLHKAQDKTGRSITTAFLDLPPRDEIPDYYQVIKLPTALSTIESKLHRNAYPTITTLESDLKRMVQNAKDYNAPKSDIFEDAERIRKLVYNFMKQHNPQYKTDPNYVSFPTPILQTDGGADGSRAITNGVAESTGPAREASEKPKRTITLKNSEPPSDRKTSIAPSATTGDGEGDGDGDDADGAGADLVLEGMGFQAAQQGILNYLLHYTDDNLEIYAPFVNLPSRKLEDYYHIIKHPVSIKGLLKLTKGIHGRAPPTGATDFKTWDQFEEELNFIWRNAQEYNETGSDMYILAEEFKEHCQTLLAEAREKVEEPSGPRIKLGGPKPKVTLNLTQGRNSPVPAPAPGPAPAPAPAPTAGVTIDNEALQRQRQMVAAAGSNGQRPIANGSARPPSQVQTTAPRPQSSAHSGSPPGTAVKAEKLPSQSPALQNAAPAVQPPTNGMMPPPSMRPPSASPFPSQAPPSNSQPYTAPSLLPPTALRPYPLEAALLPAVTISTHPQLSISKPFRMNISPHRTLSQQSSTITLPSTHYFLQIAPTISKQLSMGRPYKMFVTLNGTRLNQRDTQFHSDTGKRTHVYEGSLAQGVNRIEVEVAASKEGSRDDGRKEGLDVEKVTVYANLMR
ncbi:hypothetical protein B0A50_07228 [Salinomyces thailandicus]|uniref:Bromo domain-containing protein n=1 Tax=Salinomyces thailandicus TaxID=706561 RepID=A0A4U0TM35_9PEZI|nr:hypothetical protein B0A50_07228 [Salinomyces thailandica]